jgi:signal transduction histidine kinase
MSRELRLCLDGDGRLTHAGGAWKATLGIEPAPLLGAHWTTLVAGSDHATMQVAIERALRRESDQSDVTVRMTTGPSVQWTLMPGGAGEAIAAVGFEHGAAADRLRHRVEELEALVEALSDQSRAMEGFAAAAAHQLSEPLIVAESGTIMIAEELGEGLDPDLRARLDAIGRGAARARQMVDALLMDARARGGVELEPVRTESVVARVLDDLRPQMRERWVIAEIGTLPTVRAERRLLAVIYHNLITNALKYGPSGGCIRLDAERHDGDWRLTVTSGGAPLAEHEIQRIFEPWRRIPGERRAPGSGLGLAIFARLVERLGGTVGVQPLPHGNTFYFDLAAV